MDTKEVLKLNGFMPWRWGNEDKMEGYLDQDICHQLIGIDEKCYVAALLDLNEARLIRQSNFEDKVSGNEKQIQIERIIFGKDKSKIYRDGKLILIEAIISLDKIIDQLI